MTDLRKTAEQALEYLNKVSECIGAIKARRETK
jgi:hypothetical protein